jgi:hypothetical protein
MNLALLIPTLLVVVPADASSPKNPVYVELLDKGIAMSDGTVVKLPPPVLGDGLDAAGQKAALTKVADARTSFAALVKKSFYAPVVVKVRTMKSVGEGKSAAKGVATAESESADDAGPAIRSIDLWFVAHGDWDILTSGDFLESAMKGKDDGPSRVVLQAGVLTDKEAAARKLTTTVTPNDDQRYVYSTFRLFERVELSATRYSVLTRGKGSILVAGRLDPRFLGDADYPNQWRPLLRDQRAEISLGAAHPLEHAGGYIKITRLVEPADGVFIECHIVYEESQGWFGGVNLMRQKMPVMVNEKVKTLRRMFLKAGIESERENEE